MSFREPPAGQGQEQNGEALFVYGPLCHAPLRAAVLGVAAEAVPARVDGFVSGAVPGREVPGLVPVDGAGAGAVDGLMLRGLGAGAVERAMWFAEVLGAAPVTVQAEAGGLRLEATAFSCAGVSGGAWDLARFEQALGAAWTEAAREVMAEFGKVSAEAMARRWPTACMRAATRLRAAGRAEGSGKTGPGIRADLTAARDVEILKPRTPYTEYFSLEDPDLRFRRFDGSWSRRVRRAGFIGGDAATVLPYDPQLDAVLLVEQFRVGPLLRGDPRPWSLEPIAGRIDPGESAEDCARREALEEAGLRLGALHRVADYYPSPGAVTEYLFSFVGIADLSGRGGEIGGEDSEEEDIRTHVVGFDRLMAAIDSAEAATGPLILTAYWLALHRERLSGWAWPERCKARKTHRFPGGCGAGVG